MFGSFAPPCIPIHPHYIVCCSPRPAGGAKALSTGPIAGVTESLVLTTLDQGSLPVNGQPCTSVRCTRNVTAAKERETHAGHPSARIFANKNGRGIAPSPPRYSPMPVFGVGVGPTRPTSEKFWLSVNSGALFSEPHYLSPWFRAILQAGVAAYPSNCC